MNFKIYIFGTPHNFDLYPNDTGKTSQFQMYEYESSNNVRLMIQRSGTQIIYSYLRYQLFSERNVQSAFFGMAVEFENEYCTDVKNLYILFETIYQDILQKGILLKKLSDTKTQFAILKFTDAESEIGRVENFIKINLESEYKNDFKPIDLSIPSDQNVVFKMNSEKSNADILLKQKQYAIVSVSPEYPKSGKEDEVIPQELLDKLHKKIDDLDKKKKEFSFDTENNKINNLVTVRNSLEGQSKKDKELEIKNLYCLVVGQIDDLLKECNAIQDDLKNNLIKFPENTLLLDLQEIVHRDKLTLDNQRNTMSVFNDLIEAFQTVHDNNNEDLKPKYTDEEKDSGIQSSSFQSFWGKHKSIIIIGACLLVLVVVGFGVLQYYFHKIIDSTERKGTLISASENNIAKLEEQGNTALEADKFDEAIDKFTQAGKTNLVDIAKEKAVNYWMEQAFEKANAMSWQEAINYLEKTKGYGGYGNVDKDIAEFRRKIDEAERKRQQKN